MIAPKDNLIRAEFVVMLDKIAGELKNSAGTYTGDIAGNLVVNTKEVILSNMTISGDLFLTQGIGDGNVILNNVTVIGRTVVKGGGENSIIINNSSLTGTLFVIKVGGKIRIVAGGSTEISSVKLGSGAILKEDNLTGGGFGNIEILETVAPGQEIILDGNFKTVSVEAPQVKVNVLDGTVGTMEVGKNAANSSVQVASGATVLIFTANASINVTGQGTIQTANINVTNVKFEKNPNNTTYGQNIPSPGNINGGNSGSGNSGDSTLPQTPTGLVVSLLANNSVSLSWQLVTGVLGYNIYRSATIDGEYTKINTSAAVTENSYTDIGLTAGNGYYYKVSAVNANGESAKSAARSIKTAPQTPTGLAVSLSSHNSISLSWIPVIDAVGYCIYSSATSDGMCVNLHTSLYSLFIHL